MNRTFAGAVTAIGLVAAFGIGVAVDVQDPAAPDKTVTVHVDGLDANAKPDRTVEVPRAVVNQAAPTVEDQLKAPPAATPQSQLEAAQSAADAIRSTQTPLPTAGASAGFQGCRTSFVRNQSSRRGVRPQWQVLHFTVSPNRPGWSDVDAIVALFNRTSSQASSNFVIDAEGHCAYIVPIEAKAWTQAGANPFSVSYEIVATGKEKAYLPEAGMTKLRSVAQQVSQRTGIPMRPGSVNGCAPGKSGFVQHKDFGICGGGHVDIAPFNSAGVVGRLITGAKQVSLQDVATCQKLNSWRNADRPAGGRWEVNSVARKAALSKRGVVCTSRGPVKR